MRKESKKILKLLTLALLIVVSFVEYPTVQAATETQKQKVKRIASVIPEVLDVDQNQQENNVEKTNCAFAMPEKPVYSGKIVSVEKDSSVNPGEIFEVKVFIENTGNVPWFSFESNCPGPIISLGTAKERDRESPFYLSNNIDSEANWISPNRVRISEKRVAPLHTASFVFKAKAPSTEGLYREYFTPVVEGKTWMENVSFFIDIQVGNATVDPKLEEHLPYVQRSANLSTLDLNGEKSVEVDISEQKMFLKIGETVIRTFPVSSGTYRTPTPLGNFKILSKQEVRVAGKRPHYIMPKFMMFRGGGYGIHALPSLANDRGVFWREALNHIGTRRSHGCIRLLPEHAEFAFNFAPVGTPVRVRN